MVDVVYALGYRTWADGAAGDYAFSPERIAVRLRDDPTVPRVVLADPVRHHLARLAAVRPGAPRTPSFSADPTRRHVRPGRWRSGEPTDRDEAIAVQRRVEERLRRLTDPAETVLVTSHPVLAAVAGREVWRDVAFYAWDDFRGTPDSVGLVDWAYDRMAERDVNVVAVAEPILDLIGAPRMTLVPNGIVAADYDTMGPVPEWYAALTGPVALYVGSLQGRIDVTALRKLAGELPPEWTIALVGPMQEPEWFDELYACPNVVVRPAEPRPAVLAMMAAATVCLVPHLPEADRMSPLKVYEYLGAGAPVVATDLAPMRGISSHCQLVPSGSDLAPAVREAATRPRADKDEVAAFRAAHDWDHRYLDWRAAILGG